MNYDNIISCLLSKFGALKKIYKQDEEYYHDLPYLFFEEIAVPYITKNASYQEKKCFFEFLENMMNSDEDLQTLGGVAVIEAIYFEYGKNFFRII